MRGEDLLSAATEVCYLGCDPTLEGESEVNHPGVSMERDISFWRPLSLDVDGER